MWGEDVGSKPYVIQPAYSLIDEGEEPWFPPSEDAVYWGNIARWFMGILFLLPVLYLAVHVRRSQRYAASVAEKNNDLRGTLLDWTAEKAVLARHEPTWPRRCMLLPNSNGKRVGDVGSAPN